MSNNKDRKYGIIGTVVFHSLLLLILLFWAIKSIPDEEEGILVNFGDSETGFGSTEPAPAAALTTPPTTPPPAPKEQPIIPPKTEATEEAEEKLNTQDFEEAAAIKSAEEKKRKEEALKKQQEENKKRRAEELERQKQEKKRLEQERIEQERLQKEEAERKRKEEAERKRQEELNRQAAAARNKVKNAFSGSGSTGSESSEGNTSGSGNQGYITGDPNSKNRTGSGQGSKGSGFSLKGRSLVGKLPQPEYNIQEEGIVVVEITVDKYGNVKSATPILKGTTTQNSYLWRMAKTAALKAKFTAAPNAAAYQKGTITYHFVLN